MTDEPEDLDRDHNLWEPVDDDTDYGAHGRFDDRARQRSYQLWAFTHLKQLLTAGLMLVSLIGMVLSRWRNDRKSRSGTDPSIDARDAEPDPVPKSPRGGGE